MILPAVAVQADHADRPRTDLALPDQPRGDALGLVIAQALEVHAAQQSRQGIGAPLGEPAGDEAGRSEREQLRGGGRRHQRIRRWRRHGEADDPALDLLRLAEGDQLPGEGAQRRVGDRPGAQCAQSWTPPQEGREQGVRPGDRDEPVDRRVTPQPVAQLLRRRRGVRGLQTNP